MASQATSATDLAATRDVRTALDALGFRVRRLALLSPVDPMKRGRSTHRVDLEDGRRLKARRLESADEARRLLELRVEPAEHFVRPIAHRAHVLVEPWVEGEPLREAEAEARAGEAGALLGRLHASLRADAPARIPTASWCALAREELEGLRASGRLTAAEIHALGTRVSRHDPGSCGAALVHCDYRWQNMVVDRRGRLRVVDNEWLRTDPAGWDLARTFGQWPMSGPARQAFLRGYRATASGDPGSLAFWEVVTPLWTLRIRHADPPARLERLLEALRALARGEAASPSGAGRACADAPRSRATGAHPPAPRRL